MSEGPAEGARPSWPAMVLTALIGAYQRWISPFLGNRCRFHPSCSVYAKTAIEVHGAARGSWLALRRLLKCQPFHPGGFDYVPPPTRRAKARRRGYGEAKARRRGYGEMVSAGPRQRGSS